MGFLKRTVILLSFVMCAVCTAAYGDEISIKGGATSIDNVITPVKGAFEKSSSIKIKAVAIGSKFALLSLDKGEVDAATAAHTFEELLGVIKKEKLELKNQAIFQSVELHAPVRYAIIVNKDNPVAKLSKEQLAAIFSGKATNWKEFGGADQQIIVVWSGLTPGTNALFAKKILSGAALASEVLDVKSVAEIRDTVAALPEGIGIVAETNINAAIKKVEAPELISSPIILITVGKPLPKVQALVDFIKGEGKKFISQ